MFSHDVIRTSGGLGRNQIVEVIRIEMVVRDNKISITIKDYIVNTVPANNTTVINGMKMSFAGRIDGSVDFKGKSDNLPLQVMAKDVADVICQGVAHMLQVHAPSVKEGK